MAALSFLDVSCQCIIGLCQKTERPFVTVTKDPIPDDAQIERVEVFDTDDRVRIWFSSKSEHECRSYRPEFTIMPMKSGQEVSE